jgi:hypothetical protein
VLSFFETIPSSPRLQTALNKLLSELARDPGSGKFKDLQQQRVAALLLLLIALIGHELYSLV